MTVVLNSVKIGECFGFSKSNNFLTFWNEAQGKWKNYKTNKMVLGKINIRTQSSRANESPTNANYRGVGLAEMIYSIQNKKKHRCNGNLSLHVLNIIDAIHNSAKKGKKVKINQLCERPTIFSKKEIKSIIK